MTRGLDPSVRMKPSGIDWLGDAPQHWRTSRLKFESSHIVDCLHATPEYVVEGLYPAIRTADVEPGKLRLSSVRRVSAEQYALWTSRLVPLAGDIVYSREGERYGMAALVPDGVKLCISQRMMVFRIEACHNPEYFMWQLNCQHVRAQASADIIGATSPHVNVERIRNFQLLVPPCREQREIVASVSERCSGLDFMTVQASREIDLVREYRTRLISDVVSGKLDVRDVELPTLNEAEEDLTAEEGSTSDAIETDEELEIAEEHEDVVE